MEREIADYDKYEYDYVKYWEGNEVNRSYEDKSERYIIKKLLPKPVKPEGWFCDLGGGFGRLADTYKDRFGGIIISDYSIKNLQKAQEKYKNYENVFYVALNAYHLPFVDGSLDALLTIRLMHHLEDAPSAIREIARTTKSGGKALIEFSNKKHFVEVLRSMAGKSKMKPFSQEPSMRGDLFYNFHPKYIKNELIKNDLKIEKKRSVSNFRSGILKKIIPTPLLLILDKILRPIFDILDFGPSIFFLAKKKGDRQERLEKEDEVYDIQSVLACPKCNSNNLMFLKNEVRCKDCENTYTILDNIYDFRV